MRYHTYLFVFVPNEVPTNGLAHLGRWNMGILECLTSTRGPFET